MTPSTRPYNITAHRIACGVASSIELLAMLAPILS
jgi:hypothetical protein